MLIKSFIFIIIIINYSQQASIPPTWIRDLKIDAGQVKAVNYANGTSVNAGTSHFFNQPFVNATFTTIPRFIYAMNSYGIDTSNLYNTTSIGYSIAITQLLTTYYNLTVTVYGIKMLALNYQYIAIQGYNHLYFISMDDIQYSKTFDNSFNVANNALGSVRTTVLQFQNPFSYTLNSYNDTSDLILKVWPVSFTYTPLANVFSLKVSQNIINKTHFSVQITVDNQMILQKIRLSIFYTNKTAVFQNKYNQVLFQSSVVHRGGNSSLTTTTFSNVGTTPFNFRNALYGYQRWYIPFLLNGTRNMFYFIYASPTVTNPQSIGQHQFIQQSTRACVNGTFTIFRVQDRLCHDSCPATGYYINTTFQFCNKCHITCINCTSNTDKSCTSCNTTNLRILTNNSCPCITNYVDINNICTLCHYTCQNCINLLQTGCSSCLSTLNRQLANQSTCSCINGYYSNNTCMLCFNRCATCTYHMLNSTYQCLTCAINSSRIVINSTSCICDNGYYQQNSTCFLCSIGCTACTSSLDTSCTSCNTSSFRTLVNNSCPCQSNHINISNVCQPCHYTCSTCSNTLQTNCQSCSIIQNRQLINNSTCQCISGYYHNTTCMTCINSCLSCSFHSNNQTYQCLSCNATSNKIIVNQSCVCSIGLFENNNNICIACNVGCLNCSSLTMCYQCNSTSLFSLSSNNTCICPQGHIINGSICIVNPITVCGNGLLESGQQCDDSNTINFDGCSSTCIIQDDHICINNASLSSNSICYYNKNIIFTILSVYKVPLQNSVSITLSVSAQNCNEVFLKIYLQTNISIQLKDKSRLLVALNSSDLVNAKTTYNTQSNILTVEFQYDRTIDLSKKLIVFNPSLLISQSSTKYFFSSPAISTQLITPTNKLLTIFYNNDKLSQFKILNNLYLALIISWWFFFLISVYFNQIAIMVESLLVMQIVYQSLIKCQFINQGWSGLIQYGKYTYGYNIQYFTQRTYDKLQIIDLNSNIFNTLNLSFAILFISIIIICIMIFYQTIKLKLQQRYQQKQRSNDNRVQELTHIEQQNKVNQKVYDIKRIIILLLIQLSLAFSFITVKITTMTFFYMKDSILTLAICTSLYIFYVIIWLIYYKFYQIELFRDISFKKIIRQSKQQTQEIQMTKTQKIVQIYIKYYYLIMFCILIVFSVINSIEISGIALFIMIIMLSIAFIIFGLINSTYYRKQNAIRAVINVVSIIILMILQLIQSRTIDILQQPTNIEPIIGLTLLFSTLLVNTTIIIRIQYKKYRNSQKIGNKKRVKKTKKRIKEQIRNQTQQPIQKIVIFENIRYEKPMEQPDQMNMSQQNMNKNIKFSRHQQISQISLPQTNKKMAVQLNQNNQKTKQKLQKNKIDIDSYKNVSISIQQDRSKDKTHFNQTVDKYKYRYQGKLQDKIKVIEKEHDNKPAFQQLQIIYVSESDNQSNRTIKNNQKEQNNVNSQGKGKQKINNQSGQRSLQRQDSPQGQVQDIQNNIIDISYRNQGSVETKMQQK